MTIKQAVEQMTASYVKKFGKKPAPIWRGIINGDAHRVVAGEKYRWEQRDYYQHFIWGEQTEEEQ